jgi:hypothetical protein
MQYAYRLSNAQNAWQDSRLASGGISSPSLWYLTIFCMDSKHGYPWTFCYPHFDIDMKRERFILITECHHGPVRKCLMALARARRSSSHDRRGLERTQSL